MPTPCLNAFWHSDPYIFLHFVGNVLFCLVPCRVSPVCSGGGSVGGATLRRTTEALVGCLSVSR